MSHKVHPKIYRVRELQDWDTRGFYRNPAVLLEEDYKIREFIKSKLGKVGIEKIEIDRYPSKINIILSSARPGFIIGRGGEGIETLRKSLEKILKIEKPRSGVSNTQKREIRVEIREIRNPWISASLSAQWVAQQIEKRIPYRRTLKQAIQKISDNKEVKGVKVEMSGRLDGNEIARREWLKKGQLPLTTLRADIDFAKAEAMCTYGTVGIKVWIYKGEKLA